MRTIDKSKPVLVTGATGYIAGWLIKKLLEEGLTVHASVRDPENSEKIKHLDVLAAENTGKIRYFKSDLLEKGSYGEAMEACELVFHTASPFTSNFKDAQKDLIDPAVIGTRNVLEQASETASVKRVVLTSSCAAIYTDCTDLKHAPNGVLTEDIWNTTASLDHEPYSYSKTLAEKEAWKITEQQSRWDLVVINPCLVMGPALNPRSTDSESMSIMKQLGDGSIKWGVPNLGLGLVDVRDVAFAHYQAGFIPEAKGRHITCGHNTSLLKIAQSLIPEYGSDYPISGKAIPKGLAVLVGPLMSKTITRKFIRNNVNMEWKGDNSKSIKELGMNYRSHDATTHDAFQALIDEKII